jgi:hypothetical protein
MPTKRTRHLASDADSAGTPVTPPSAGGLEALLRTVYDDLRAANAELLSERARNQALEHQVGELRERAEQSQVGNSSKEIGNARLPNEVSRLLSQPATAPRPPRQTPDQDDPPRQTPDQDDRDVYVFKLEKAAKSNGGDKFVCERQPEFNIYFPQNISRQDAAAPCQFIQVRIERRLQPAPAPPPSSSALNQLNANRHSIKLELVDDNESTRMPMEFKAGASI